MPVTRIDPNDTERRPLDGLARILRYLFVIGVALVMAGSALRIYLESPSGLPKPRALEVALELTDPNGEANLFAWYSTLILAVIGLLFFVAAFVERRGTRASRAHLVIAVAAFYLSADEAAKLHEKLNRLVALFSDSSSGNYAWLIVAIPVVLVVGLGLLWVGRSIDRTLRNRLVIAGIIFLAGAVGFEAVDAVVTELDLGLAAYPQMLLHEFSVFFEEVLEVTGALLALRAILGHLNFERSHGALRVSTRA